MNAANPWAIWFVAVAGPLLLAFLVRRWRRRQVVSSVVIFRRLFDRSATRRRFAHPQHWLALLLTLLALAGLLLAALNPRGEVIEPRRYLVLLDTSASMRTQEQSRGRNRLARALDAIETFARGLNSSDEVALITAGPEASVALGWTDEHLDLPRVAARLEPGGDSAGIQDAFRIADAMCQQPGSTEIILVSDGGGLTSRPSRCPLRYVRIGESAANVAITGLTVREADALGLHEIYLALQNASDLPREITVELTLDGFLVDVVSETLDARSTVERLLRLPLPGGDVLQARIQAQGENGLAEDDVAYALLHPGGLVKTLLVTEYPTTFLAEALALHPRVDLTMAAPEEIGADAGPFDLVVLESPLAGPFPSSRHILVADVEAERFALTTSGRIRDPEIIRWAFRHPLFRFVNLDGVHLASATSVNLPDGAESVMDMPDGPLAFLSSWSESEVLYLTFHPDRSDLPLRVAFVNFVANVVQWAQPTFSGEFASHLRTGERFINPGQGRLVLLTEPSRPIETGQVAWGEPMPIEGVYELHDRGGPQRALVAVNLFAASEADLEPVRRLGVGARYGWPVPLKGVDFPWWLLVLTAFGLLLLEWLLPGLLALANPGRKRRRSVLSRVEQFGSRLDREPSGSPRAAQTQ